MRCVLREMRATDASGRVYTWAVPLNGGPLRGVVVGHFAACREPPAPRSRIFSALFSLPVQKKRGKGAKAAPGAGRSEGHPERSPPCFQSPFRAAKSICENALRGPSRCAN